MLLTLKWPLKFKQKTLGATSFLFDNPIYYTYGE